MIETKHFTPEEARRTLPLVKKIVKDILTAGSEIKLLAEDLNGEIKDNPEIEALLKTINIYINELEEIGCYYKDWNFSIGLVDFPSIINNKEVLLCWRSDEEEILYYHDFESGYQGRKPIPEEYLNL